MLQATYLMGIKILRCVFLIYLVIAGCNSQPRENQTVNSIIECVHQQDSTFFSTLDRFEEYLLVKNYIQSTSHQHYISFLNSEEYQTLDPMDVDSFVFADPREAGSFFSPLRITKLIKCINESPLRDDDISLYELTAKVLFKRQNDLARQIGEEIGSEADYSASLIEYEDIPTDAFGNSLIHYCFLWDIYPFK